MTSNEIQLLLSRFDAVEDRLEQMDKKISDHSKSDQKTLDIVNRHDTIFRVCTFFLGSGGAVWILNKVFYG